jgi:protein associated with RNAse G/E
MCTVDLQPGDRVTVSAHKADGTRYRRWRATVEAVEPGLIVVVTYAGHRVEDIDGDFTSSHAIRGYYWLDRNHNLLEAYRPDGTLAQIYVNVSSPPAIAGAHIRFTDYELDVSRVVPHAARIVDQDEFAEAAVRYGYSAAFQHACYRAAEEAVALANGWVAGSMPRPVASRQDS